MKYALSLLVPVFLSLISFPLQAQVSFFQPPTYSVGTNTTGNANNVLFVADFNGDGKPDILTQTGAMNTGNGDGTFITQESAVSGIPLAVADFNGDGTPDFLTEATGTLSVQLGKGDGKTFQRADTNIGADPIAIAAADLNGDGKADVVGVLDNSLVVYLAMDDGTFQPGVSYDLGVIPPQGSIISFGDFNGDGKTDVVVSIPQSSSPPVAAQNVVLLGNGDGTFQTAQMSPGVDSGPSSVSIGDFNQDGKSDLIITGFNDYLLLGNGDGTFQAPTMVVSPASSQSAQTVVADVNGDQKLDLVLEDADDPSLAQVYLGNGDGTFSNFSNYILCTQSGAAATNATLNGLAVADFDSDGKQDIAGCGSVLLGNGDGTFKGWPMVVIPNLNGAGLGRQDFTMGDFDQDKSVDVAVINNTNSLYILRNDGTGSLAVARTYNLQDPSIASSSAIVSADFNGDGNLDLAVAFFDGSSTWSYGILLGNGDGTFQSPVLYPGGPATPPGPLSLVASDFNNDQKPDLAVSPVGKSLAILTGNGDGTFAAPAYYDNSGTFPLVVADFNGDGNLDIASGSITSTTPGTAILLGKGDGTFQTTVFPSTLKTFAPIFTADLRNDGTADLLGNGTLVFDASAPARIALGNGDGTFSLLGMSPGLISAISDFDFDGKLDVLVTLVNGVSPSNAVQLGNGDGTFGVLVPVLTGNPIGLLPPPPVPPPAGGLSNQMPAPTALADMNRDGAPDLIFTWPFVSSSPSGLGVILNTTVQPGPLPDFTMGVVSATSQTVSAGKSANFILSFAGNESFSDTVNLACRITPPANPAPTCNLSSASVEISGSTPVTVTVNVGTTSPVSTSAGSIIVWPRGPIWAIVMLSGLPYLLARSRKRLSALATPVLFIALALSISCAGASSTSRHTASGTPTGTYTATITATSTIDSGGLSHNTAVQVIVR